MLSPALVLSVTLPKEGSAPEDGGAFAFVDKLGSVLFPFRG